MNQVATVEQTPITKIDDAPSFAAVLNRLALDPAIPVDRIQALLDMQAAVLARQAAIDFGSAMSKAQTEMRPIEAKATNPQTRSKYAKYAQLDSALRPIYTANGFSLSFDTDDSPLPEHIRVVCYVSHVAGHSRRHQIDMPSDGKGAKGGDVMTKTHAAGSAISYGMRYLLKMIFNVAVGETDDDGNNAGNQTPMITESQAADLQSLADEVKFDKTKFFAYLSKIGKTKITAFGEIPAVMFKDACAALEKKRKAKK